MRRLTKIIAMTIIGAICAACATEPTEFGMPVSQFKQLSAQQKQAAIASYNQQQASSQQLNNTLTDLGEAASAISGNPSQTIAKTHNQSTSSSSTPWTCQGNTCSQSSTERKSSSGSSINVGF